MYHPIHQAKPHGERSAIKQVVSLISNPVTTIILMTASPLIIGLLVNTFSH